MFLVNVIITFHHLSLLCWELSNFPSVNYVIPIIISYSTFMRESRNMIGFTWCNCIKSHYKPDNSTYNNKIQKPFPLYVYSKSTNWFLHNDKKYPILAQNGQTRFFWKKWILPYFITYYSLTPCKKWENFNDWISRKSQKTLFWANKIFFEKSGSVTF